MDLKDLNAIVDRVDAEFQGTQFLIFKGETSEGFWLQVGTERPDTNTGEISVGKGGKAMLPHTASENQVVKCIFGLIMSYVEHETREGFKWNGKRVFNPHLTVQALHTIVEDKNLE